MNQFWFYVVTFGVGAALFMAVAHYVLRVIGKNPHNIVRYTYGVVITLSLYSVAAAQLGIDMRAVWLVWLLFCGAGAGTVVSYFVFWLLVGRQEEKRRLESIAREAEEKYRMVRNANS